MKKKKLEKHSLKGRRVLQIESGLVYGIEDVYEFSNSIRYITFLTYRISSENPEDKSHGQIDWEILETFNNEPKMMIDIINENRTKYKLINKEDEDKYPISTY